MLIAESGKAVGERVAQVRKTRLMREVESRFGQAIDVLLYRLYIKDNLPKSYDFKWFASFGGMFGGGFSLG